MLSKLFKKNKPNIYLGSLLVAPRSELKKFSGEKLGDQKLGDSHNYIFDIKI